MITGGSLLGAPATTKLKPETQWIRDNKDLSLICPRSMKASIFIWITAVQWQCAKDLNSEVQTQLQM